MKMIRGIYKRLNFIFRWLDPIFDIRKFVFSIPNYIRFFVDLFQYTRKDLSYKMNFKDIYPRIHDNTEFTGFDRHYIYHPAWAARILKETKPDVHFDISSTLHFCSLVSAFIPIKFYDFRPARLELSSLSSEHADLINLHFENSSIGSLSCMHTVEHVGLGRYGDPIDPDGDIKAINELKRVLASNGDLLFVVPVGKPKIMYNAHRIYSYNQVVDYFKEYKLMDFSLVPDDKELGFISNATRAEADSQKYGCGCFWFKKIK
jgi:hypothetical protein